MAADVAPCLPVAACVILLCGKLLHREREAITYVFAGDTHGRLLSRTPRHELAESNSWEDPVFDEVSELVPDLLDCERGASECFGRVLGVVCDPAPSGHLYDFAGKIWCPTCGAPIVYHSPDNRFQCAKNVSALKIPAGAAIILGKVGPRVRHPEFGPYAVGGGTQIYVANSEVAVPLGPVDLTK